ncbi:MAG TPA: hypothetical protein VLA82_11835 [Actinomycetota bacterium]|nr:hypothetical protein [Actinomycetota bacterium]
MDESARFTVEPPAGTCPECGSHVGDDELPAHMERHTGGLARDTDDAGGVVPDDQQADNGAGRVQTE